MEEYEKLSWGYMATKYNFIGRAYGQGKTYNFPPHWSNGWISEMNPADGLFVASAWFTPDRKLVHKINTDKSCLWIFCVDCGEITYTQQGKKAKGLSPITHMIINPQKPFSFTFSENEHYCFTSVLVYNDFIQSFIKDREDGPKIGVDDARLWETQHLNTPNIMLILEQIRWAVRNSDISLLAYEGMILHLLCSIARNFPEIPRRRANRRNYVTWENEQKIYKVKEIIDSDILNVPNIKELCKIGEMSESRLRESFKNTYGVPLYEYTRIEIMKRAMQLLSADHLSIRDISERCGFKNASKFSAAFKAVHGITPSEFRKAFNL